MAEHDDHHRRLRLPEAVASQKLEHKRCRKRRRCSQLLSLRSSSRGGASASSSTSSTTISSAIIEIRSGLTDCLCCCIRPKYRNGQIYIESGPKSNYGMTRENEPNISQNRELRSQNRIHSHFPTSPLAPKQNRSSKVEIALYLQNLLVNCS